MVPLDEVPVAGLERGAQDRRSLQLVAHQLGALRGDHQEADALVKQATGAQFVAMAEDVPALKAMKPGGKEHPVDSKPVAFEIAGREAFKLAVTEAGPVLFEPIMNVRVVVPDAHMGDVMGNLSSRRGQIQSQDDRGGTQIIAARVPLSEMHNYSSSLRSLTQGRAKFSMRFHEYAVVPFELQKKLQEEYARQAQEELV